MVGGGSAGSVVAARLAQAGHQVLLVEAGPKDTVLGTKMLQWKIHMPAALTYNLCDDKYNWYYHTVPQEQTAPPPCRATIIGPFPAWKPTILMP